MTLTLIKDDQSVKMKLACLLNYLNQ